VFEDTMWLAILACFKQYSIVISGGSPTKRHLLSPLHIRLSLFLFNLVGLEILYETLFTINQIGMDVSTIENKEHWVYEITWKVKWLHETNEKIKNT